MSNTQTVHNANDEDIDRDYDDEESKATNSEEQEKKRTAKDYDSHWQHQLDQLYGMDAQKEICYLQKQVFRRPNLPNGTVFSSAGVAFAALFCGRESAKGTGYVAYWRKNSTNHLEFCRMMQKKLKTIERQEDPINDYDQVPIHGQTVLFSWL